MTHIYRVDMLSFIDLFFKKESLTGTEGSWITPDERKKLESHPLEFSKEMRKKRGNDSLDFLVAAGTYDANPLLKKAILTFKYKRIKAIGEELATLMAHACPPHLIDIYHPVLSPVPLHWTRQFLRGFNQSDILATHLSARLGSEKMPVLKRIRSTGHQAHRTREERLTALEGAFRYIGPNFPPENVLLIDDLVTTGATLNTCAKTLKRHGVKRVFALVIAQG